MKNYWLDKIKAKDEFSWKYNTEVNNSVDVFSDIGVYNVKCQLPSDKDIACFRASMEKILLNSDKIYGCKIPTTYLMKEADENLIQMTTKYGQVIEMNDTFSECQE